MHKPAGYYVLIKVDKLQEKATEFTEGSSLIMAAPKQKRQNEDLAEREQNSHDIGTIVAFGPLAFLGYNGCDADTAEGRAAQWGVAIDDKVDFNRHDGKRLSHLGDKDLRVITDSMIICKVEE